MEQKQLCDLISLCLISLHLGIDGNRENFIGEFLSIVEDKELANSVYEHLCAIAVGMRIA